MATPAPWKRKLAQRFPFLRTVARNLRTLTGARHTLYGALARLVPLREYDVLLVGTGRGAAQSRTLTLASDLRALGLSFRVTGVSRRSLAPELRRFWTHQTRVGAPKALVFVGEVTNLADALPDASLILVSDGHFTRDDRTAVAAARARFVLGPDHAAKTVQSRVPRAAWLPIEWPVLFTPKERPAQPGSSRDPEIIQIFADVAIRGPSERAWLREIFEAVRETSNSQLRFTALVQGKLSDELLTLAQHPRIRVDTSASPRSAISEQVQPGDLVLILDENATGLDVPDVFALGAVPVGLSTAPWRAPLGEGCLDAQDKPDAPRSLKERLTRLLDTLTPAVVQGASRTTGPLRKDLDPESRRQAISKAVVNSTHPESTPLSELEPRSHRLIDVYLTTSRRPDFLRETLNGVLQAIDASSYEFRLHVFVDHLDSETLSILAPHIHRLGISTTCRQMGLPFLYNLILSHQELAEKRSGRFADYVCYIQDDCLISAPEEYFDWMVSAYERLLPEGKVGYVSGFYCAIHPGFEVRPFRGKHVLLSDSIDGKNFMAPPALLRTVGPLSWYFPDGERRGNPGPTRGSHFDLWQWKESPQSLMAQNRVSIVIPDLCAHIAQSAKDSTWGNETSEDKQLARRSEGRVYQTRSTLPPIVHNKFR